GYDVQTILGINGETIFVVGAFATNVGLASDFYTERHDNCIFPGSGYGVNGGLLKSFTSLREVIAKFLEWLQTGRLRGRWQWAGSAFVHSQQFGRTANSPRPTWAHLPPSTCIRPPGRG